MSSFHFTVRIDSKSFSWTVRSVQELYLPKFLATSDFRYWVNHVGRCAAWLTDTEKSRQNWKQIQFLYNTIWDYASGQHWHGLARQ